jgi:predicted TPR repeat methyltransferase
MGEEAAGRVGRYWDSRARQFDRIYRETPFPERVLNRLFRRAIYERSKALIREVQRLDAPTLLDVGSGSGVNSLAALEAGASFARGVDVAPAMVALARERAAEAGLADRSVFEQGEFMSWTTDETFDVVAALGVFDYVSRAEPFFARMAALARSSVVASFPGRSVRGRLRRVRYGLRNCPLFLYDEDQVREWSSRAGLAGFEVPFRDSSGFVAIARR